MGALCPLMRMAPGACDDSRGDRPCPDPMWQRAAIPPLPRPLPVPRSPRAWRRRWPEGSPTLPALRRRLRRCPPPLAAVNRHAAGSDVGADAHDVAVPPRDEASPVRGVGAGTVALEAWADGLAPGDRTTVARALTGVDGWRHAALRCGWSTHNRGSTSRAGRRGLSMTASGGHGGTPSGYGRGPSGPPTRWACDAVTYGRGACC